MRAIDRAVQALERVSLALPMAALLGASLGFALYAMPGTWIGYAIVKLGLGALLPLGAGVRWLIVLAGAAAGAGAVWALFARFERPAVRVPVAASAAAPEELVSEEVPVTEVAEIAPTAPPVAAASPLRVVEPVADHIEAPDVAAIASAPDIVVPEPARAPTLLAGSLPRRFPLRWLRARRRPDADGVPTLRRADAHPDAPSRRPIFAAADLGAPLDTVAPGWLPDARWNTQADMVPASAGLDEALLLGPDWRSAPPPPLPSFAQSPVARPAMAKPSVAEPASAASLMARLEAALAERPGRPASPPMVGAALHEAMQELRKPMQRG